MTITLASIDCCSRLLPIATDDSEQEEEEENHKSRLLPIRRRPNRREDSCLSSARKKKSSRMTTPSGSSSSSAAASCLKLSSLFLLSTILLLVVIIPSQELNLNQQAFASAQLVADQQQQQQQQFASNSSQMLLSAAQVSAKNATSASSGLTTSSANSVIASSQQQQAQVSARAKAEFLLNLVKTNFHGQQQHQNQSAASRLPAPFKSRAGQQREHMHYKTTYACEGNQLELSCEEGKLIHLVRANYGRFSLSICNELGHSNLSVQCAAFRAFLLVETRCNKLSNCSIIVSKELFGDPCEGTSKYLEVQYSCDDANNNNHQQASSSGSSSSASSPSAQSAAATQAQATFVPSSYFGWHSGPANQAAAGQTSSPPSAIATPSQQQPANLSIIGQHSATPSQPSGGHKSPGERQLVGGELLPTGDQFAGTADEQFRRAQSANVGQQQQQAATNVIHQQQQLFCSPQTSSRNLYWNLTRAGQTARQACPDGSSGLVSWPCRASSSNNNSPDQARRARFWPAWSPNFSQCKSNWLQKLGHQLDQALAAGRQLRDALQELALMAPINQLFGQDLRLIDALIGKIISHHQLSMGGNEPVQVYEELLAKLVQIVSSLFHVSQRNAWLELESAELGPETSGRQLEQSLLSHLKNSGALLASAQSKLELGGQHRVWRQENVFAAITVISNDDFSSKPNYDQQTGELVLQLSSNQATFDGPETLDYSELASDELRIAGSLLRELSGYGATRLLLLDAKKPDYAILRQQREHWYASSGLESATLEISNNNNNLLLLGSQQQSRVFGVFAIASETGQVLGDDSQQSGRQWPISVHFRLAAALNQQQQPQQQVPRQCSFLGSPTTGDRCQSLGGNSTNHACRCDQLGFVELATSAAHYQQSTLNNQIVSLNTQQQPGDFQWPQMFANVGVTTNQDALGSTSSSLAEFGDQARASDLPSRGQPNGFIGAQGTSSTTNGANNKQSVGGLGVWATIFIVFGLSLLVISLAAFVVSASLRASAQSRLSKKQASFLGQSSSMLGHHHHHHHHHHGEPTTGPLAADHGLIGGPDGSAQSTSIIGLTQAACHGTNTYSYKAAANQQLYQHAARHLSSMGGVSGSLASNSSAAKANRWARWTGWLTKPAARWLPFVSPSSASSSSSADSSALGAKLGVGNGGMTIQHRVLVGAGGSSLVNGGSMVSYKSQYQNGYTTNLHHQSALAAASSRVPLAAPTSSSTSSYVSSSAYYEEIGPGNLTKVNTSQLQQQQLSSSRAHTIVDPFKRQAPDQQQLLHSNAHNNLQQQHLAAWPPATTMAPALSSTNTTATSGRGSYSMEQASHYAGQPMLAAATTQSQQSFAGSSSTGSQHSANSNNLATTPRHYLFASPSAVSAYKSSMGQQQQHYFNQKQQQPNQFRNQQENTQAQNNAANFTLQG